MFTYFYLKNENDTSIAALWEVKSIPQTNVYDNETGATFYSQTVETAIFGVN